MEQLKNLFCRAVVAVSGQECCDIVLPCSGRSVRSRRWLFLQIDIQMRWCSSFRLSAPDCKSPQRLTLPANAASHWLALLKASGFLRHKMWRYLFLHLLIRNILSKIVIHHHGKLRNLGCLLLGMTNSSLKTSKSASIVSRTTFSTL